jgi:hypothetical protein
MNELLFCKQVANFVILTRAMSRVKIYLHLREIISYTHARTHTHTSFAHRAFNHPVSVCVCVCETEIGFDL